MTQKRKEHKDNEKGDNNIDYLHCPDMYIRCHTSYDLDDILDTNSQHLLETLTPFINPLSHIKDLIQEVFFLHPTYKTPIECIHT